MQVLESRDVGWQFRVFGRNWKGCDAITCGAFLGA